MGIVLVPKASCSNQYYIVWNDKNEPILSKETLYETEYNNNNNYYYYYYLDYHLLFHYYG